MENNNLTPQYRQEIESYLSKDDKTFEEGFALLQKFSRNLALISYIGRKCNEAMFLKINYELAKEAKRRIIKVSPYYRKKVVTASTAVNTEQQVIDNLPDDVKAKGEFRLKERLSVITNKLQITPEEMPAQIKELYNEARRFYHLKVSYFTAMKTLPVDAKFDVERAKKLKLAKEYESLNKKAWAEIDRWANDGKPNLDNTSTDEQKTAAKVAVEIGSAKSYISKFTDSLNELEGKKYEKRKKMLTKKVNMLLKNNIAVPSAKAEVLKQHEVIK